MGKFRSEIGPFLIERRRAGRSRATCAASLVTSHGESFGQLRDLLETGAIIQMMNPPAQSTAALLKWASEKVACQVTWARDGMCGLTFERPIDRAVVTATARIIGGPEQPCARLANMSNGRKRSERDRSDLP